MVFLVRGMRLDLLRIAAGAGAGAGAGRAGVRPLPIGLPQLADPGRAAKESANPKAEVQRDSRPK